MACALLPSIFPLYVAIFFFFHKKEKGFPLQSGLISKPFCKIKFPKEHNLNET